MLGDFGEWCYAGYWDGGARSVGDADPYKESVCGAVSLPDKGRLIWWSLTRSLYREIGVLLIRQNLKVLPPSPLEKAFNYTASLRITV